MRFNFLSFILFVGERDLIGLRLILTPKEILTLIEIMLLIFVSESKVMLIMRFSNVTLGSEMLKLNCIQLEV